MDSFGRKLRVSIFGESHGPGIGVVIDGVPAGMQLSAEDFTIDIARRAAGAKGTTARKEKDIPEFVSGVWEGHTTGSPLTILFRNTNLDPDRSYADLTAVPRPGHADFTAAVKWDEYNDYRGGGHFSGRITLPIVAAGVIAKKILTDEVQVRADLVEMGGETDKSLWSSMLDAVMREGDSYGGIIECNVEGLPVGLGEPFFDSVESLVSHAVFAIPGIRGIEFGDGFAASRMKGSEHNDPFGENGQPVKNGSGGVNGGITNGAALHFRVAVKPTSSIAKAQKTLNFKENTLTELSVHGRNDACFALRTPVVVEAMTALALADLLLIY